VNVETQMIDEHKVGVLLVRRGLACGRRNEMESGVLNLVEGLSLLDVEADPRLTLCALHNLALFLTHLGLTVLARAVLLRAKPLYQQVQDPLMSARLLWLEGSLARRAGRFQLAERKLEQARLAFQAIDFRQAGQIRDELADVRRELKKVA